MLRKCNLAGCLCLLWLLTGIDQAQGQGNQPRSSRQSPLTQVTASQPAADTTEVEEPDTTRLGSGIERKAATKPFSLRDREIERYAGFWTPYRQRISPLLGKPFSQKIELDSSGKFYYLQPRIGNLNHRLPMRVPYRQLEQARTAELYQQYFRTLSRAADGTDPVKVSNRLIPPIKLPPLVNRLFGGDQIDLQPNGSIMLD